MLSRYNLRREHIVFLAIVLVGLVARLYEARYSFDGDEVFSVKLASKEFSEVILGSLQDRPHPPLHNVLLHLWGKAFGTSEVSARMLSVLFSGIFLILSFVLLRRLLNTWLALGVLSILSLSPLFVYYGQQARPYALIACLSSGNLLACVRVLDVRHDSRRLAIWAASCCLLLYAQYLGILVIGFEIAVALFCLRSGRLKIFAYGFVGSVLILPWLIEAMGSSLFGGTDPLRLIAWIESPSPVQLVWFYVSIFGDGQGLRARWLLLMLAFLGMAYTRHLAKSKVFPSNHALFLLIGVGVPTVVFLISVWGPKPIFASRQLLSAAIAFVAGIGLCIATLPRSLAAGFLLTLVAWTTLSLPQAFPHNTKPPWKDMAAIIDERYGAMVVLTQEGWVREPLEYYRRSAPVLLLSEFPELEENNVLFVCRPVESGCSNIEIEALKPRRSLVSIKRWGSETSEYNELRVYEIKAVSE